ncbi:phospholipid scramblase 3-like [Aquarana catesbeiana]|uniref:phospholipid scramblase 3-like n=1 Tax=Aquarana catesbeiana TaxID=8400 RepID=UPI003CC9C57C
MSAGYPAAIHSQPQWQNGSTFSKSTAIVPPGLECLVEVEEVILKHKVFQTKNEQDLFTVRRESECCGPSLNLRLRDPYKRDVVSLYLISDGGCCGGQTYLKVCAQSAHHIGNVRIVTSSSNINVYIERGNGEPVFSAKLPVSLNSKNDSTIEILNMDSSQPVAFITKEKEGKSSQVIFHFPLNMEAALKAVILASFLYVGFRIREMSRSHSSGDSDFGWAGAGGVDFADMSHGGGGDWGGGAICLILQALTQDSLDSMGLGLGLEQRPSLQYHCLQAKPERKDKDSYPGILFKHQLGLEEPF